MRYFIVLSIAAIVFTSGCQPVNESQSNRIDYSKIAGTWKTESGEWQVTISEDGEVVSAVHALGSVLIKPNQTTRVEMGDGSVSSYTSGDFKLIFDEKKNEMEVTLKVKTIHIKYLDNEIDGKNETIIGGTLSKDFMEWDAEVIEVFDYGPRFPQGDDIFPKAVKFNKVSN